MNKDQALAIILEQAKYVLSQQDWLDCPVEEFIEDESLNFHMNGDSVAEYCCVSEFGIDQSKLDKTRIHVTQEAQHGGEGEGDEYWYVFKIDHPDYVVSYIQFSAYYDSWNGTDWYDNAQMVTPYEYISVGWKPVKG